MARRSGNICSRPFYRAGISLNNLKYGAFSLTSKTLAGRAMDSVHPDVTVDFSLDTSNFEVVLLEIVLRTGEMN